MANATKLKDLLTEEEIRDFEEKAYLNRMADTYIAELTFSDLNHLGLLHVKSDVYGRVIGSRILSAIAIEELTNRAIGKNIPIF